MTRFVILLLAGLLIAIAGSTIAPTEALACSPGSGGLCTCNHNIIPDPVRIWQGCSPSIRVDIVQHSFHYSGDWYSAITGNAIAGWNAAYRAKYPTDLFHEVGGRPYDVKFQMYDEQKYIGKFGDDSNGAAKISSLGANTCCGAINWLSRVPIYIRDSSEWHFVRPVPIAR